MKKVTIFLATLAALLAVSGLANASPGISYHGRLLKPNGRPVTSNSVQFKVQIRTPLPENCLLYEEIYSKDLSASAGTFTVTINDGTATVLNTEPYTLDRVFQNRGTFYFPAGKCAGSDNEYTPSATDGRQLYVSFNDGTFADWEPLPPQSINFVPAALESVTVGGHRPSNFFRVMNAGNPNILQPWTPADYQTLLDLVANTTISGGNASIGGNAAGFTGSLSGDVTGGQSTTRVEKIQGYDVASSLPGAGQVLTWNNAGSRWEPVTPSSSATPAGPASGDLAGNYPGPVIAANAVTTTKINDGAVTTAKLQDGSAAGQIFRFDGADWQIVKLNYRDLINNFSGSPWPLTNCVAGQAVVWLSASDAFSCQNIMIDGSNIVDGSIDTLDLADGSVTTPKIQDGAVTNQKIVSMAVNKITSGPGLYLTYAPNNAACSNNEVLKWDAGNSRWICGADNNAGGTVTSVGLALPSIFTVSGSPVTTSGTLTGTLATQAQNTVFAGPLTGTAAPTFRNLRIVDIRSSVAGAFLTGTTCGAAEALKYDASTDSMSCQTISGTTPSGSAGGDLSGNYPNPAIAVGAVTSAKILDGTIATADLANLAVTDAKINSVNVSKIDSGVGSYFTYAPNNVACTNGQVLKKTANGWECGADNNAGGTVTSITAGTGLTGGTITLTGTIGLGTELTGVNALNTTGFVKRTGAGAYTTSGQVNLTSEITGVLPIANGGTGASTATAALTNLLPAQSTHAGKVLGTNGTGASWVSVTNGTVTSVTGTAPISVASGTTTPVISLDAGGVQTAHLANGAVTDAKIAGMAASKLTGTIAAANFPALTGDVTNTAGSLATTVVRIRGRNVAVTAPVDGQILKWNGTSSQWEPSADNNAGGTVTTISATAPLTVTNPTTTPSIAITSGTVTGQMLRWNGTAWVASTDGSALTLNATNLTTGSIPAARIAASTITSSHIANGTIVDADIANGTITSGKLAASVANGLWTVTGGDIGRPTGSVGIGTASPVSTLDVRGLLTGGIGALSTGGAADWSDPSNARSGSSPTLLLGTATNGPGGGNYFHPFNFEYGSAKDGSGQITQFAMPYANSTSIDSGIYFRGRYSAAWSPWRKVISEGSGGNVGIGVTVASQKLEVAGNVKATAFISTSDRRLKRNIATVDGIEKVLKLRGVEFDWRANGEHEIGLIAQEVEAVYPDLVVTDPNTGYKAVKYSSLVSPLIEATKDLYGMCQAHDDQIKRLQAENAALKAKNQELESRLEAIERHLGLSK